MKLSENPKIVGDLKQILQDYDYLKYDETLSNRGLLRVNVAPLDAKRNIQVIKDICHSLSEITCRTYFFTYGGSYTEADNVEEVWSFFTLKEVDFDQHAEIQLIYEIIRDVPSPTFQIEQSAA